MTAVFKNLDRALTFFSGKAALPAGFVLLAPGLLPWLDGTFLSGVSLKLSMLCLAMHFGSEIGKLSRSGMWVLSIFLTFWIGGYFIASYPEIKAGNAVAVFNAFVMMLVVLFVASRRTGTQDARHPSGQA